MYQYSRALHRELRPLLIDGAEREALLACERSILALTSTAVLAPSAAALFRALRHLLRPDRQLEAHALLEVHLAAALDQLAHGGPEADAVPARRCGAHLHDGGRCQRAADQGSLYCSWHRLPALAAPPAEAAAPRAAA